MPRIVPFGGGGSSATPGGASGAYQYNNAGAFGGSELTRISATVTAAGPDSATPAAYTLRGQGSRAGTDVDVSGASLTIASGPGTGAAAVSSLIFQTPAAGASGSAAQSQATRLTLSSASATATVPVVAAIGTVTTNQQCFSGTATWNAAGVAFTAAKINVTNTASAPASFLLDLQIGAVSQFSVSKAGVVTAVSTITGSSLFAGSGGTIGWTSRSAMLSPSDGTITLTNNAGAAFTALNFGGATSSFPALKRSSATLICRLADDTADAVFEASRFTSVLGMITADAQVFGATATWNSGGTMFTAMKVNITDNASAAASKLLDLQVGGATRFAVDKAGQVTLYGGSATAGNTMQLLFKEEQISVANGVSTQDGTASWIPASAYIIGMTFKVDVQPGGTATFSAGTFASTAAFAPTGTSTTAATTFTGGGGTSIASTFGVVWSGSARTVRLTFNAATTDPLGRVTVRMWYFLPTVA